MTFSFNASNFESLELRFALNTGSGYTLQTVDLGAFDGIAAAEYSFTTASGASYDNFMITGTVVPEPLPMQLSSGLLSCRCRIPPLVISASDDFKAPPCGRCFFDRYT